MDAIKNININSKPLKTIGFFSTLSDEAKKLMADGKTKYNLSNFTFASKIYNKNLMLQEVKDNKQELKLNKLNNNYNPQNPEKIKEKDGTLKLARKLFFIREENIRVIEKGIFPYIDVFKVRKRIR